MAIHACTNMKRQRKLVLLFPKKSSIFSLLIHCLILQYINIASIAYSACLSVSFMSIKVPLNPLFCSHNVNVEHKECIQIRSSEVWGYSAKISHWRKVNMVRVMRLEPDWDRRRGHMGLIMAQLSDSEAVFIDQARARILETLETPSMLMKPTLEIAPG